MNKVLINLDNVSKVFNIGLLGKTKIIAVDRVSTSVHNKEILGILGESGSGKSTIAKLILKIIKPTSGKIMYDNKNIWEIDNKDYYRKIQGVFQDPYASFNPRRRVIDVLMDTLRNYYPDQEGSWEDILEESLNKVGLNTKDIVGRYPHEFSGGQLQRLSIARVLLVKPEIIIADEPVSMVDASTRIDILNIFIDLREIENMTSVIIGHDLSLAYYVSDRVIVLYRGQVVEQGPVDVLRDPAHPYTKMLLEAVPKIDSKWTSPLKFGFESIELSLEGKCVFAHRCPYRMEICVKQEPPIVSVGKSSVKCWLYAPK